MLSMTRTNPQSLTQLVRTAEYQGASLMTLEALVARAAEEGAKAALYRCGLQDEAAGNDIRELRVLLDAWRDTRRTVRRTLVHWLICGLLTLILAGAAIELHWFR